MTARRRTVTAVDVPFHLYSVRVQDGAWAHVYELVALDEAHARTQALELFSGLEGPVAPHVQAEVLHGPTF